VYDAILGEASDLLVAAMEAQSLGRLKMASAYQLLLHARLVGLGKRFDRALLSSSSSSLPPDREAASGVSSSAAGKNGAAAEGAKGSSSPLLAAISAQQFAKYMPPNIELDTAMMEHLARAAMELHNKRTGRGLQHEAHLAKQLYAHHQQQQVLQKQKGAATAASQAGKKKNESGTGVAWTEEEKQKCRIAADQFGQSATTKIAEKVGTRSEAQVRAFLRNARERAKVSEPLALDMELADEAGKNSSDGRTGIDNVKTEDECSRDGANVAACTKSAEKDEKEGGMKMADCDVSNDGSHRTTDSASSSQLTVPVASSSSSVSSAVGGDNKRKGGRGKKPPTLAMHTVPNANFDARSMLFGGCVYGGDGSC